MPTPSPKPPLPPASLPPVPAGPVTLPLVPALRAAYQEVYDQSEILKQSTHDLALRDMCNAISAGADDVLTKDNLYRIEANTVLFEVIQAQIKDTLTQLTAVKKQIEAVASHIAVASSVVGAIDKLLTLVAA